MPPAISQSISATVANVDKGVVLYIDGITDEIAGGIATTSSIAAGGTASGMVYTETDQDWFSITLTADTSYVFTLAGSGSSGALNDPYLSLYDASGNLLRWNDDASGSELNSRLTFTATSTGTYFLGASAYISPDSDNVGTYQLTADTIVIAPLPFYSIDQIATYLTTTYWTSFGGGSGYQFPSNTVTYNVTGLPVEIQALARLALATWSDVANLTFQEVAGSAQLTFDDADAGASTSGAGGNASINVGADWVASYGSTTDSYTFQTYVHEIGHALGLGHAGPYNGNATYGNDNIYINDSWAYSVMSYFDQLETGLGSYRFVLTPQLGDIVAIANIYGAATATRTGDTVYGHNATAGDLFNFSMFASAPAFTIYDSNGVDTIDTSGYSVDQTIDLRDTAFSSIGGMSNNIAIARGVVVENAIGGSAIDTLHGNAAANVLAGRFGNDQLFGLGGSDRLEGEAGVDCLHGDDLVLPTANAASVYRLYLATLARGPDPEGHANWTNLLDAGATLTTIAAGFVGSAEFTARYGAGLGNTDFVTLLYNNVLHRAPDATGLGNWVGALNGGASRASVVTGFSDSAEFSAATIVDSYFGQVYRLYGATLDRQPDGGGFENWFNALYGGMTLQTAAAGFVGSTEFQLVYGALDNTQFVTQLYSNVLDRAPDSGGLASWVGQLDQGSSRASVVVGFSESAEYLGNTNAARMTFMRTALSSMNDILEGGAGNDQMAGGHGNDTYTFRATETGSDQIWGFQAWDTLRFVGFSYADQAAGLAHASQSGSDVIFTDQGETITFHAVQLSALQQAAWILS